MKKTLLTIFCSLISLFGVAQNAKVYSEPLFVTINGETSEPQTAEITVVDNGNGTINFVLQNFFLSSGEEQMPVGNVCVENIPVTTGTDGLQYFAFEGPITIQPGTIEGVDMWMGPMIGEIPLKLEGKMNEEKLFVTIDIDMQAMLQQVIYVQLGTDDFASAGTIYTEQLLVTINGETSEPQTAEITVVDNGNGTINFVLQNFFLSAGEEQMPVGNVCVENIPVTTGTDGLQYFTFEGPITIQPGTIEGVDMWMGPMIGEIPLKLEGKMNDEKLFVTIDIDMQTMLQQVIYVQLGTDDFASAGKVYTEQLLVTINGETSEPQTAEITVVDNGNGTINFVLQNFFLSSGEEQMPVGNVCVENIPVTTGTDGLQYFTFEGPITIQPGTIEGVDMWMGPMIGEIPLKLEGKMNDEKLYVTIDIELSLLGQVVHVELGTDDFVANTKGDLNGDSKVDIADAVTVLNAMAGDNPESKYDVNEDGKVDIADFVSILNLMAAQ